MIQNNRRLAQLVEARATRLERSVQGSIESSIYIALTPLHASIDSLILRVTASERKLWRSSRYWLWKTTFKPTTGHGLSDVYWLQRSNEDGWLWRCPLYFIDSSSTTRYVWMGDAADRAPFIENNEDMARTHDKEEEDSIFGNFPSMAETFFQRVTQALTNVISTTFWGDSWNWCLCIEFLPEY